MGEKKISEYITLRTVARELDSNIRTVRGWAIAGKLESHKLFNRHLVEREYFEEWKQRYLKKVSN